VKGTAQNLFDPPQLESSVLAPPQTWKEVLAVEKEQPYFQALLDFVEQERRAGKTIYPKNSEIFNALAFTSFLDVKVVILGQDPYHGPRQAHGLCFSVLPPTPPPPSLLNIFTELRNDIPSFVTPNHGCLESWAKSGVLLLNAVLTVEEGRAGSHANKGWERFTDKIIRSLDEHRDGLVFMLWGSYAQKKAEFVNRSKHFVLQAPHPSPLSASRGFFGCRHFSQANVYLRERKKGEIDWRLPLS